jgi:ribose/xylose/arabinose/galactoside ABC-type transport system permease subunit
MRSYRLVRTGSGWTGKGEVPSAATWAPARPAAAAAPARHLRSSRCRSSRGSFGATSTDLFLVVILAAVFLGGPGQAYGAMVGAVIIGLATEISAAYITPSYKDVIAFVVLLAVMAVRPGGVLGATA